MEDKTKQNKKITHLEMIKTMLNRRKDEMVNIQLIELENIKNKIKAQSKNQQIKVANH